MKQIVQIGGLAGAVVAYLFVSGALAQALEHEDVYRQAAAYLASRDTVSLAFVMTLAYEDEVAHRSAEVSGRMALRGRDFARFHLVTERQEIEIYNTPERKIVHVVKENRYQAYPTDPDRAKLITAMMSGPMALPSAWLANFLHNIEDKGKVTSLVEIELDGAPQYNVHIAYPQYEMVLTLSADAPHLPRRFVMNFTDEGARRVLPAVKSGLRITAEFSDVQVDAPLPEAHFRFVPSPSTREVKPGDTPAPAGGLTGKQAPDFTLELLDGGTMDLARHRGQNIVILDFWASWCGPCRRAMPIIEKVVERFQDQGVVLYAVNVKETRERARSFLESTGLALTVAMDTTGAVAGKYQVTGIPRFVIIDKKGDVAFVQAGVPPDLDNVLSREIQALLEKR